MAAVQVTREYAVGEEPRNIQENDKGVGSEQDLDRKRSAAFCSVNICSDTVVESQHFHLP